MNAFFAGLIGAGCGMIQLLVIMGIELSDEREKSGFHTSDRVFPIFAALVMTEILCVRALSMDRISPWLLRKTGDDWKANRVSVARQQYGRTLQRTTVIATVLRRLVVMADAGSFAPHLGLSLGVALASLLVPEPRS